MLVFLEGNQWCVTTFINQSSIVHICSCQDRKRRGQEPIFSNMGLVLKCPTWPSGSLITDITDNTEVNTCNHSSPHGHTYTHIILQSIRTRLSSAPSLYKLLSESIMSTCRAAEQRGTSWRHIYECISLCVWIFEVLFSVVSWGESARLLHCCCKSIIWFMSLRFFMWAYSICILAVFGIYLRGNKEGISKNLQI